MYSISNLDIIKTVISGMSFILVLKAHRIIFPKIYCSINAFVFDNNSEKSRKSSIFRILATALLAIGLQLVLRQPSCIIIGMTAGAFLIAWVPMTQYKLLSVRLNKNQLWLLVSYFSFIISTIFIAIVSTTMLYPTIFMNQGNIILEILGNDGVGIVLAFLCYSFSLSIDTIVGKNIRIEYCPDVDTFHEDLDIVMGHISLSGIASFYKYEINRYAEEYGVSPNILGGIVALEHYNRGHWTMRQLEKAVCLHFTQYAVKRDITVGLCQIKISTAQDILEQNPDAFTKRLLDPDFNIKVCAQYLAYLYKQHEEYCVAKRWSEDTEDLYTYISNHYLGYMQDIASKSVRVYSCLLRHYDNPSNCYSLGLEMQGKHY